MNKVAALWLHQVESRMYIPRHTLCFGMLIVGKMRG